MVRTRFHHVNLYVSLSCIINLVVISQNWCVKKTLPFIFPLEEEYNILNIILFKCFPTTYANNSAIPNNNTITPQHQPNSTYFIRSMNEQQRSIIEQHTTQQHIMCVRSARSVHTYVHSAALQRRSGSGVLCVLYNVHTTHRRPDHYSTLYTTVSRPHIAHTSSTHIACVLFVVRV